MQTVAAKARFLTIYDKDGSNPVTYAYAGMTTIGVPPRTARWAHENGRIARVYYYDPERCLEGVRMCISGKVHHFHNDGWRGPVGGPRPWSDDTTTKEAPNAA